jgi:ferritin
MISEKLRDALNTQVNEELQSYYIYLGIAAYFQEKNLNGFAHWMHLQAEEERNHAMRIYNFLYDRGARVNLLPLDAPPAKWDSPLAAFEESLAHERKISGMIHDLVDLAVEESDHPTQAFLQWFVNEQVEEEATADDIIQQLKLVGDAPTGLFLLDRELAQRRLDGDGEA